jgi:hypothetical protein
MNFSNASPFTDSELAYEEAQFLVEKHRIPHSIVKVKSQTNESLYVVPTETVSEVFILETFVPVQL